jgi:Uma2 family endonuclease
MRVKVSDTGLYTYPDVVAVCGEPRFEDAEVDTLLNPQVLVEVLSPKTEAYDRGDKFAHYRRVESLQEYVMIAQDRVRVEHYLRQGEQWLFTELSSLDDVLRLRSIDCELPVSAVYSKLGLPSAEDSSQPAGGAEG